MVLPPHSSLNIMVVRFSLYAHWIISQLTEDPNSWHWWWGWRYILLLSHTLMAAWPVILGLLHFHGVSQSCGMRTCIKLYVLSIASTTLTTNYAIWTSVWMVQPLGIPLFTRRTCLCWTAAMCTTSSVLSTLTPKLQLIEYEAISSDMLKLGVLVCQQGQIILQKNGWDSMWSWVMWLVEGPVIATL